MLIRKRIVNALSDLGLPIEEHYYEGSEEEWITWQVADERGSEFEGGIAHSENISIQVHLFVKADTKYETLKKQIKKSLINAGFTHPIIKTFFEEEVKKRHFVFSCEITAEMEELNE